MTYIIGCNGVVELQAALAAHTQDPGMAGMLHHPISCTDELELDEWEFRCPHVRVPISEWRTMSAIQHSIAILIFEEADRRFG